MKDNNGWRARETDDQYALKHHIIYALCKCVRCLVQRAKDCREIFKIDVDAVLAGGHDDAGNGDVHAQYY